jgi:hypothetical protein
MVEDLHRPTYDITDEEMRETVDRLVPVFNKSFYSDEITELRIGRHYKTSSITYLIYRYSGNLYMGEVHLDGSGFRQPWNLDEFQGNDILTRSELIDKLIEFSVAVDDSRLGYTGAPFE